jgi:hypothetical protein
MTPRNSTVSGGIDTTNPKGTPTRTVVRYDVTSMETGVGVNHLELVGYIRFCSSRRRGPFMRASSADRLEATRSVSGLKLVRPRDRFKDQQRRLVNKV